LINQAKLNGEIVVDFYQLKGWYTFIHAKYFFRIFSTRIPPEFLLRIIKYNMHWLLWVFDTLCYLRLGFLTRFLPIADIRGFPKNATKKLRFEWAVLDTFDALSPIYDSPQRITKISAIFEANGCKVDHAGVVAFPGGTAAVVRASRIALTVD
jgi:hypothetical protein